MPINQATSSSAIGSGGGDDAEKPADSTVEEEITMSEIKRPKTGPNTHVLSVSSTVEYTEGMSGTVEYTEGMSGTMEYTEGCPGRRWQMSSCL